MQNEEKQMFKCTKSILFYYDSHFVTFEAIFRVDKFVACTYHFSVPSSLISGMQTIFLFK